MRTCALALTIVLVGAVVSQAQDAATSSSTSNPIRPLVTRAEQEHFLLTATITDVKGVKVGVTGTSRATLSDGTRTHDASVQTVDESHARYETAKRIEFNFRDYWGYNVAAYRLGQLLGLDMIPASVMRRHRYEAAAFTWWVDDVAMDERERVKRRAQPANPIYHSDQVHLMRVFDELIGNVDRNQGNMLFDIHWKLWLIDHSRAFRLTEGLRRPQSVRRCERTLLARMRGLTREALEAELGDVLTPAEMTSLLKRRDKLVAHVDGLGATALFDLVRPVPVSAARAY
ncbi:MAG TPA: hypothetical protein VMF13_10500 [Luteitalea sp.]|nr:hypothetical protein [Luteitalea sp.]